jgi:hypothetical protein
MQVNVTALLVVLKLCDESFVDKLFASFAMI